MDSFVFGSYSLDESRMVISFEYSTGALRYIERITLPRPIPSSVDGTLLDRLLFNLHLALGISYWKMQCNPKIEVKSGTLNKDQALFWETVYTKGLGEFYYRNTIDFRSLVSFPFENGAKDEPRQGAFANRQLVGIGGGKDSLVTWERLKKDKVDATGLIVETQKKYSTLDELLAVGSIPVIRVERTMDKILIEQKNNPTSLNGHIPISMIYAWVGLVCSAAYDYSAFVASNEKSANEGNTEYLGMTINHQWSKSEEFEHLLNQYVHRWITPDLTYYSPLRQKTELEIVKEFVSYPQYFPVFSSCNRNFSIGNALQGKRWCGQCPKCAFAFLMFAAYLPKKQVIDIFEKDMLADSNLLPLFRDLGGRGNLKPFECVGTFDEVQEALTLIQKKGEFTVPAELLA